MDTLLILNISNRKISGTIMIISLSNSYLMFNLTKELGDTTLYLEFIKYNQCNIYIVMLII